MSDPVDREQAGQGGDDRIGLPSTVMASAGARASGGQKVGDRIGRYKLLQQIGEGGCGVVYMAEQEEPVRRRVALKVIKLGMDTKAVIARFEAERQALALMDHPNIAKVLDAGATETGRPYFVMELVKGVRITQYCDQNNLPTTERLALFTQVCHAIQHAHQKGIIHRDIKPSNILVTMHDGVPVPKVIDFGIAKATDRRLTDKTLFTAFEQLIGTPAYMSPEQAEMSGLDIDTRSDIYALGVLLYELLTGKTPFDAQELLASGLEAMRRTIREVEPARPSTRLSTMVAVDLMDVARHRQCESARLTSSVRGDLDWIVMKALEKDRTRRYDTASSLALDIGRHLNNEPILARPPTQLYRFRKMVRRNKLAFGAVASIGVVLVLGSAVSAWQAVRATRAEREQRVLKAAADKARETEAGLRQLAQNEASRAEAAAIELKMSLSASDFLQGLRFISEGNGNTALAYLVRSLSANPTNDAALARLTSWLTYHSWAVPVLVLRDGGRVGSAQFSPDGKRIVAASENNTVRIWDAETGQPFGEPMKHASAVISAQFSRDGKQIVTCSYDKTARVWDAQTGHPVTEPVTHSEAVNTAQFSADGKRILTTSYDKTARVWDAQTGVPLTGPFQHGEAVYCAQFSPDGKRIVTGSGDQTARLWDAETGQAIAAPMNHGGAVFSAQFSPDGKRIVTSSDDKTARVWDAQTGRQLTNALTHRDRVVSAQFSPDGTRIVTASADKSARVWDAASGQPLIGPLMHGREVTSAQFSLDAKRILTTSFDRTARVWDAATGEPLCEPMRHSYAPAAQFSRDGKRVLTVAEQNSAQVWDVQSGEALAEPLRHAGAVSSARFSPDGRRILTGSEDKNARVWNALTGQMVMEPLKHDAQVVAANFSPDGKKILTTSADGRARVWDTQTGRPLTEPLKHGTNWISAQFSPDGLRIVTAADNVARIWDAQTGEPLTEMPNENWHYAPGMSPDGSRIVTAVGATAQVRDAQTGQPLTGPLKHGNSVWTTEFSPDGKQIITTSYDATARIWDAQSGKQLGASFKHGVHPVRSAQLSRDGRRLLTASDDRTARVWDVRTGQRLAEVAHDEGVPFAQFSPDGRRILTTSWDKTARLWDARTGQPVAEPMKEEGGWANPRAHFSPDGRRILTSADNAARVWDIAPSGGKCPDWLLALSEAISGVVLKKEGLIERTPLNRAQTLNEIRQQLNNSDGDDDWTLWGRWLLADRSKRTISPYSKVTVPEYNENRDREKAAELLDAQSRKARSNP